MTSEDIKEVIRKFVSAAKRAKKAGFDGVQLHGCHGFVLSEFMKSSSNHRRDAYGGSIAGRFKLLVDIDIFICSLFNQLGIRHIFLTTLRQNPTSDGMSIVNPIDF